MSGPKTSRYTLTPAQRKLLAEQRKMERRKATASESIKRSVNHLLQIGRMFDADKQVASELRARTQADNGFAAMIDELDALLAPVLPLAARVDGDDVASLESTVDQLKASTKKAEALAEKLSAVTADNEARLKGELNLSLDKGFATSFADVRRVVEPSCASVAAIRQLKAARSNTGITKALSDELDEAIKKLGAITDEGFARNYIALVVNPLLRKAEAYAAEYALCHEEFEAVYAEYIALCELYYYVAQAYECSADAVAKIKAEITRIKEAAAEDDEQAYISQCLDEVMTEMGYAVIGRREVTKKSGKHFRSELYTYAEGTAVSITYSSDGRIAMELGGLDTNDRVPTAAEAAALCDSMAQFCGDFQTIEKRLLEKGVIAADRISMLPPKTEYAQIINTSDYSVDAEIETLHIKKQRRKTTAPNAMRME